LSFVVETISYRSVTEQTVIFPMGYEL